MGQTQEAIFNLWSSLLQAMTFFNLETQDIKFTVICIPPLEMAKEVPDNIPTNPSGSESVLPEVSVFTC